MVTKVSDVKNIVKEGLVSPKTVFAKIKQLAANSDWKVREVAATALVEISKKKPDEVVAEMLQWSNNKDANIRRAASEGLRDIARKNPVSVLPVLVKLKTDGDLYVKKSVANVLRNATRKSSSFVIETCKKWATLKNSNTNWIIKDGLRKAKQSNPNEVAKVIDSLAK